MLNPCCDLPTCEQPDIEPDAETAPRNPVVEARQTLRMLGFKCTNEARADFKGEWWELPFKSGKCHGHVTLWMADGSWMFTVSGKGHEAGQHELATLADCWRSLLETP